MLNTGAPGVFSGAIREDVRGAGQSRAVLDANKQTQSDWFRTQKRVQVATHARGQGREPSVVMQRLIGRIS
jgi:hypothetical protein